MFITFITGKFLKRVVDICSLLFLADNLFLNSPFNLKSEAAKVQETHRSPSSFTF